MTNSLAKCHECAALLPDNPDDRRAHLALHRDVAKKLEAQRQRVGALQADVLRLVEDVKSFRRTLDNHPITAEPAELMINEIPDEDIDAVEDAPESTYADEDVNATVGMEPTAGEPVESPADEYPLAIDRQDEQPVPYMGFGPVR